MKENKLILDREDILTILGKQYLDLSCIFSDKFGIINAILERHELDKYHLYMYQCLSANTVDLFHISRDVSSGGLGIHEDKRNALTSCLAEALERYCMSYIPKKELIICQKKDLDQKHVVEDFSTYTEEQYQNYSNFLNPNTDKIEWTKIYDMKSSEEFIFWPASLIYLPFDVNKPVAETTSTGMAAGFSIEECIQSGLMELIERDALMINFMQRLNPPEIKISTIKGSNQKFLQQIMKEYKVKIYRLYSDIPIPVYLSIIYKKEKGQNHYGIGACASIDSDYAINKSLKECLFTYFYSMNIMDAREKDSTKIKTLYEHFLYYQKENFDQLLFDGREINYRKEKVSYKSVLGYLKSQNINVYYKELTTEDIKKTGLKVVKVVAPSLIDLNKSHIYPRLGAKRFFEVPKKLGLAYKNELTELPHPFP